MLDEGTRPLQWPTLYQNQLPVIVKNNVQLAQKPLSLPPSPQIAQTLTGSPTGFQFSFKQVTVPTGQANVIDSYRVYRNTANVFGRTLVHTFKHDPTHQGSIVFSDVITSATGAHFYYWVTSVDTFGQESSPQAAQSGTIFGSTGSIPPSLLNGITYTSTTTSITWSWTGLIIFRADGTTTTITDGNRQTTGLTASTTYNFYPYWDEKTQAVLWVNGSGTGSTGEAWASTSNTQLQQQGLRNRIPMSGAALQASTPASGSGSGSGGGRQR